MPDFNGSMESEEGYPKGGDPEKIEDEEIFSGSGPPFRDSVTCKGREGALSPSERSAFRPIALVAERSCKEASFSSLEKTEIMTLLN